MSLLTAYCKVHTAGKNWRVDWGPPGRRRPPYRPQAGVSEAVATRQTKSGPRPVVPAHRGVKGRPMARPVPGHRETCDWGHPRPLSERNGMHSASGYRVRTDAEHVTPLAGPTYRARTRYRLAGPPFGRRDVANGSWDRPAVLRWDPRVSARGGCQTPRKYGRCRPWSRGVTPLTFGRHRRCSCWFVIGGHRDSWGSLERRHQS